MHDTLQLHITMVICSIHPGKWGREGTEETRGPVSTQALSGRDKQVRVIGVTGGKVINETKHNTLDHANIFVHASIAGFRCTDTFKVCNANKYW